MLLPLRAGANKATDSLYEKAKKSFEVGEYAENLAYCLQALHLTENGTCTEKANAYLKTAHACYYLQQKEACIQYLIQLEQLAATCNDSFYNISLRQLGTMYFETGKKDSAKHYLHLSEKLLLNTHNWRELSTLYSILGEVYKNHWDRNYFTLAEEYAIKANDTVALAFAKVKQGSYAAEHGDCNIAYKYLNEGLNLYRAKKMVEGEMYALIILAQAYSDCGKAKETYTTFRLYDSIRDSIFKKETANKAAHYRTLYESEKKERENAELIKDRKLLIAAFVIALLLLSIGFLYFHTRYKIKKQKEMDEKVAAEKQRQFEAVIDAEEKERKRIAGDLHDGVGQTMSAAKINLSILQRDLHFADQEQALAFEKVVALVDESCKEVRSVSHNMMPNTLLRSGLAMAVRNFISQIDQRVLNVDFYSEGLHESLEANREVILYRVIQECVNNVIKHANATRLTIALIKDEDGISATVEDNGKGFDTRYMDNLSGIGLQNIHSRITYLNGTVEWDSAPGKGTVVSLHIPAAV